MMKPILLETKFSLKDALKKYENVYFITQKLINDQINVIHHYHKK